MDDLISRQAAIDAVMELIEEGYEWRSGVSRKISLLNAVYCALEDIPSAQPTVDAVPVEYLKRRPSAEPVRHGKWMEIIEVNELGEPYQSGVYCSECGHTDCYEPNYCPDCGARMDK